MAKYAQYYNISRYSIDIQIYGDFCLLQILSTFATIIRNEKEENVSAPGHSHETVCTSVLQ